VSRAPLVRAIVALGILAAALFFALTSPARLGLDLRGGTQIVLQTEDSPTVQADAESTDRALEVLRRRVDALGVSEPTLARSGERRIIVELPGVQDPREAAEVIGRTAQLTFHPVLGPGEPDAGQTTPAPTPAPTPGGAESAPAATPAAEDELVLPDDSGQPVRLGPAALTGEGVGGAQAGYDLQNVGGWFVSVDFQGGGQRSWEELTGSAACSPPGDPRRRVAIVLDEEVISSPQVDPEVACDVGILGGSTQITGSFSQEEAQGLAVLIQGGALPVPVEIIEQRTVGPTLGAAAIDASAKAALIGIALTGLFIVAVYRLMGALATVALGCYALLSYAALVALGATLTLPGLAGFVLAVGMAIDANVLVFERAREEYAAGRSKGLRSALSTGFAKAWTAILDSNVTTLLAAGLLFFLASGPVRGFGVTLSIGVLASMVSALVVARVLTEWAVNRRAVIARPRITGLATTGAVRDWLTRRDPDIMGRRRLWLAVSAATVLLALAGIGVRGLNLGVEFTGGRLVEYSTSDPVDADTAREAVSAAGFPAAVVQTSGEDDITVRTGQLSNDEEFRIQQALSEVAGEVTKQRDELIGPSLGDELRTKALIALFVALGAQMVYLAVRFRWTFAAAAVLAMLHDVLLVVGVFAWLAKPIDGVFLAAALSIIGLSVNDTVVVFDRVRELWSGNPGAPFARTANSAVLQTVPRTVNTGLGAMFILAALAVLGGSSLTDFALALLLGLLVGTYSSVFTATPLAVELQARSRAGAPRGAGGPPAPGDRGRPPVRSGATAAGRGRAPGDSGAVL
jgi:SecD/SecF fusion protein